MKIRLIFILLLFQISNQGKSQILKDYLQTAAKNNPGLNAKYKEFEAALQVVPQVNALADPTFSLGYFVSPVETRVGPQRARFSLSQMFPWFGTLEARENAAAMMAQAKYQSFLDYKNQLFYQVAAAYYPMEELQQLIRLEEENLQILETYKAIATSKFENGTGAMVDVLRVDLMINDSKTNLKILKGKYPSLLSSFNALLNKDSGEEAIISDSVIFEPIPLNYRKDSLLYDHPLLTELDRKIKSSEARELSANLQARPKFGVGLDYVLVDKRSDMEVPDNGKNILMPMISVSIPIFQQKNKSARVEEQLMQESYTLQKKEVSNVLIANYELSTYELNQQQEFILLYQKQTRETKQVLNLLFSAYSNTGKEFEEVLRMQQQLLKYEQMKISAITKYKTGVAKIDYLTSKTLQTN
ncbi:TolC family protein [Flexithrix dorotheae]|uniref:TolC family protein n=1 Tax=Flexithrix dorotheae TaxID=70993 RepID=UPI000368FA96|nr:TolC family protein [Flexithrix dorotheae]